MKLSKVFRDPSEIVVSMKNDTQPGYVPVEYDYDKRLVSMVPVDSAPLIKRLPRKLIIDTEADGMAGFFNFALYAPLQKWGIFYMHKRGFLIKGFGHSLRYWAKPTRVAKYGEHLSRFSVDKDW